MTYDDIFKGAQQRRHLNLSPTPATLTIRQIVKICLGTLADQLFYTSKMKDLAIEIDIEIHVDIESATRVLVTVPKVCVLSTPTLG